MADATYTPIQAAADEVALPAHFDEGCDLEHRCTFMWLRSIPSRLRKFYLNLHWFLDNTAYIDQDVSVDNGRYFVLDAVDGGGNNFLVVLVAGAGFFLDSYLLFASNVITPMLGYCYWNNDPKPDHGNVLNFATLGGAAFGMILFGILGDRYGRKQLFGFVLLLLIMGTVGSVMCSTGFVSPVGSTPAGTVPDATKYGSMNIVAWLVWWRFITGVGLGGDYPIAATMVSEFAPTKRRGRMLAAVFAMQAFGYATANIVSIVVIAIVRRYHPVPDPRYVDEIWRWVIGLSLIPAVVATVLRLTIPESPRFVIHVRNIEKRATPEFRAFYGLPETNRRSVAASTRDTRIHSVSNGSGPTIFTPASRVDELEKFLADARRYDQATTAKEFFATHENWKHLLGTSSCWFLLDISFYALSLNSPQLVSKLWYDSVPPDLAWPIWDTNWFSRDPEADIYKILLNNSIHSLTVSSIGAILGSVAVIYLVEHINRRKLQIWGFVVLGLLFIITGVSFRLTVEGPFGALNIPLFALCSLVFYMGANTTTFMYPAELFPTKYRATCHGISAAAGKVGSILTQLFLSLAPSTRWVGYILIIFGIVNFLGAISSRILLPDLQQGPDILSLEQLVYKFTGLWQPMTAHSGSVRSSVQNPHFPDQESAQTGVYSASRGVSPQNLGPDQAGTLFRSSHPFGQSVGMNQTGVRLTSQNSSQGHDVEMTDRRRRYNDTPG